MAQDCIFIASVVSRHRETGFLYRAGDLAALERKIESVLAKRSVEVERTWAASVARCQDAYERALATGGRAQAVEV